MGEHKQELKSDKPKSASNKWSDATQEERIALEKLAAELPLYSDYLCPISRSLMQDPVSTESGHSYERKEVEPYLRSHKKDPLTGEPSEFKNLRPNRALKKSIEAFVETYLPLIRSAQKNEDVIAKAKEIEAKKISQMVAEVKAEHVEDDEITALRASHTLLEGRNARLQNEVRSVRASNYRLTAMVVVSASISIGFNFWLHSQNKNSNEADSLVVGLMGKAIQKAAVAAHNSDISAVAAKVIGSVLGQLKIELMPFVTAFLVQNQLQIPFFEPQVEVMRPEMGEMPETRLPSMHFSTEQLEKTNYPYGPKENQLYSELKPRLYSLLKKSKSSLDSSEVNRCVAGLKQLLRINPDNMNAYHWIHRLVEEGIMTALSVGFGSLGTREAELAAIENRIRDIRPPSIAPRGNRQLRTAPLVPRGEGGGPGGPVVEAEIMAAPSLFDRFSNFFGFGSSPDQAIESQALPNEDLQGGSSQKPPEPPAV